MKGTTTRLGTAGERTTLRVIRAFVIAILFASQAAAAAGWGGPGTGGPGFPGGPPGAPNGHRGSFVPGHSGPEGDRPREDRAERERPRRDGAFTDEERRALHRDLDKANRELYRR